MFSRPDLLLSCLPSSEEIRNAGMLTFWRFLLSAGRDKLYQTVIIRVHICSAFQKAVFQIQFSYRTTNIR